MLKCYFDLILTIVLYKLDLKLVIDFQFNCEAFEASKPLINEVAEGFIQSRIFPRWTWPWYLDLA